MRLTGGRHAGAVHDRAGDRNLPAGRGSWVPAREPQPSGPERTPGATGDSVSGHCPLGTDSSSARMLSAAASTVAAWTSLAAEAPADSGTGESHPLFEAAAIQADGRSEEHTSELQS